METQNTETEPNNFYRNYKYIFNGGDIFFNRLCQKLKIPRINEHDNTKSSGVLDPFLNMEVSRNRGSPQFSSKCSSNFPYFHQAVYYVYWGTLIELPIALSFYRFFLGPVRATKATNRRSPGHENSRSLEDRRKKWSSLYRMGNFHGRMRTKTTGKKSGLLDFF